MKKPSNLEETDGTKHLDAANTLPAETDHLEAIRNGPSPLVGRQGKPTMVTLDTGETLQRSHDGRIYIGEYPIVQVTPHGLPTQVHCIVLHPNEVTVEYAIDPNSLLLVASESPRVPRETEAHWFSAYTYARSVLNQLTNIFSETVVGSALEYNWGCQNLLKAVTQAKEVFSHFPVQFLDAASLFAACTSMQGLITAVTTGCEQRDIEPFLARVMGGQAFLDVFSQLQNAGFQLPALHQDTDAQDSSNRRVENGSGIEQRTPLSIIRKEDEAEGLHDEIVDNKNPLTQLYLAIILLSTSFLAIVIQPGVAPVTACLLPLAGVSLAFKIAAYDLRPGQINFYLRWILLSPWDIVRRILFDGSLPSEQEQAVLREQNIVITEELLSAARELKPHFPDMQSTSNRIAVLISEGAAIAVLIVRGIGATAQRDFASLAEVLIALAISIVATFYSFKVLKRKRVR